MRKRWNHLLFTAALTVAIAGCATKADSKRSTATGGFDQTLQALQGRFAPDSHLAIFNVEATRRGADLILSGEVYNPEAKAETLRAAAQTGARVVDRIQVLPAADLGTTNWGITTISVANGREKDEHKAELGTQTVMGQVVRVLKRDRRWLFIQTHDQYPSWMEASSLKLCTETEAQDWEKSPLLIFTELDGLIREAPEANSPPISDIVLAGRVKKVGETGDWFKVELPDGRSGYVPKNSATDYATWKSACHPSPENIERTARQFIGRPYLWGANTPRGMDCSGLTKLTFFLNGIELHRNASQQARQGVEVPIDRDLSQLKKGDLLFFGFERPGDRPDRVSHTAIYLGDKLFIQSSGRVCLSSLDPNSPIADQARIRGLIKARRVLPQP